MADQVLHAEIVATTAGSEKIESLRADTARLHRELSHLHEEERHGTAVMGRFAEALSLVGEHTEGLREHAWELRNLIGEHGETFGELIPQLGALGVAAGATGLVEMARETAEAHTQLNAMAQTLGLTIPQLQGLQLAARETDVPVESMQRGILLLDRNMAAAASGKGKDVAEIFGRMGVSLRDTHGHLRSTQDVLPLIAESLSRTTDVTLRNAVAMKLFGRSGAELIPLLLKGKDGLEQLEATSRRLNASFTNEDNENIEGFKNSWVELDTAVGGLRDTITTDLAPVLTPVINDMTSWVAANREWIGQDIASDFKAVGGALKDVPWGTIKSDAGEIGHALQLGTDVVGGWKSVIAGVAALAALKVTLSVARTVGEFVAIGVEATKLAAKIMTSLGGAWDNVGNRASAAGEKERLAASPNIVGASGSSPGMPAEDRDPLHTGEPDRSPSRVPMAGFAFTTLMSIMGMGDGRPLTIGDAERDPSLRPYLTPEQQRALTQDQADRPKTAYQTVLHDTREIDSWLGWDSGRGSDAGPLMRQAGNSTPDGSVVVHVKVTSDNPGGTQVSLTDQSGSVRLGDVDVGQNHPMGYPTR